MRIKVLVSALTAIWLSAVAVNNIAHAGIISGAHSTVGGKTVDLGGLEWHTWYDLTDIDRISVLNAMQPGGSLDGWRYATEAEFNALFDSLWGGTNEAWHASNVDGGNWLHQNFGSAPNWGQGGFNIAFGSLSEIGGIGSNQAYYGHYRSALSTTTGQPQGLHGWFHNTYGLSFGNSNVNSQAQFGAIAINYNTHALVKETSVPEPSTLALFAFGMIGFGIRRLRK